MKGNIENITNSDSTAYLKKEKLKFKMNLTASMLLNNLGKWSWCLKFYLLKNKRCS